MVVNLPDNSVRYLLDTNICIHVINARPPAVLERFLAHEADGVGISAITASELYWGVHKSGSARNLAALEKFLRPFSARVTCPVAATNAANAALVTGTSSIWNGSTRTRRAGASSG